MDPLLLALLEPLGPVLQTSGNISGGHIVPPHTYQLVSLVYEEEDMESVLPVLIGAFSSLDEAVILLPRSLMDDSCPYQELLQSGANDLQILLGKSRIPNIVS